MQRLWAPWRKAYIRPKNRQHQGCLFCCLLADKKDSQNYIFKRSSHCFAILNLYPYNNGHVMIVPKRHVASVAAMNQKEKLDWLNLYEDVLEGLRQTMNPVGFNTGMNLGQAAGAGVPDHIHMHIVPRWVGDANFMPMIGETKVISESLDSVYLNLKTYFKKHPRRKK